MDELTKKRAQVLHGLLFAEGGGLAKKKLTTLLSCTDAELEAASSALTEILSRSGLALISSGTELALAVSEQARDEVAAILSREEERDIGDAGLEVIAVLLYEGPSTRATIDYIRGVNSSTTLRILMARGLVERTGNPADGREFIYKPTVELLAHLGARNEQDLPEYAIISRELAAFKAANPTHGNGAGNTEHTPVE